MENHIMKYTATCYDFIGREWSCSFLIQNTRHSRKVMIHRFLTKAVNQFVTNFYVTTVKIQKDYPDIYILPDVSVMFRIITYLQGNYISVRRKRFLTGKVFYLYFMFFVFALQIGFNEMCETTRVISTAIKMRKNCNKR